MLKFDPVDLYIPGMPDFPFPRMVPIEQKFPKDYIADVPSAVRDSIRRLPKMDLAGKSIAVTVGSRGIPQLAETVASIVAQLKEFGAEPFVVPAMGSHGGAVAEGQTDYLAGYGITEESVGAPIRSSMEVVEAAKLPDGRPLYADKIASEADGIVVFNKIKPHANFKGPVESGLAKMMVIGLGKHVGASMFHKWGFGTFKELIPVGGQALIDALPVVFGVGVVENAFGKIALVDAMTPERIIPREMEMLDHARAIMGRLLITPIDTLIIDRIGKNFGGSGMDTNVVGRNASRLPGFDAPPIQRIVVLGLSPETHGNSTGIGLADVTTRKCVESIDFKAMYTNCVTAKVTEGARMPLIGNTEKEALAIGILCTTGAEPQDARVVRVPNTKYIDKILVSEAYLPDIEGRDDIAVLDAPRHFAFDAEGNLID